jgi:hypothetical protein
MSLLQELTDAYVKVEQAKQGAGVAGSATQQQSMMKPEVTQNVGAEPINTAGGGMGGMGGMLNQRTMLIGGGLLLAAVVAFKLMK